MFWIDCILELHAYHCTSYRQIFFSFFALSWLQAGLQPLHSVVIVGRNAPEWLFAALGAILAG